MLLSRGKEIKSDQQLAQLISYGASYVDLRTRSSGPAASNDEIIPKTGQAKSELPVSFLIIQSFLKQLEAAYKLLDQKKKTGFVNKILRLAIDIQGACDENAEGVHGSILLTLDAPPPAGSATS